MERAADVPPWVFINSRRPRTFLLWSDFCLLSCAAHFEPLEFPHSRERRGWKSRKQKRRFLKIFKCGKAESKSLFNRYTDPQRNKGLRK